MGLQAKAPLFQFLIVRLKLSSSINSCTVIPMFQFLIVRLKSPVVVLIVQIAMFQFLIVRLKWGCHRRGIRPKRFQFLIVRLKLYLLILMLAVQDTAKSVVITDMIAVAIIFTISTICLFVSFITQSICPT